MKQRFAALGRRVGGWLGTLRARAADPAVWRQVMAPARSIPRAITSCFGVWIALLCGATGFTDLSFARSAPLWAVCGLPIAVFLALTVAALPIAGTAPGDFLLFGAVSVFCLQLLAGYDGRGDDALRFLFALIALWCGFAFFFLARQGGGLLRLGQNRRLGIGAVAAATLVCFAVLAAIGVLRYRNFLAPNFDFGIFCQMFWSMKNGGTPVTTCERDMLLSHFAVHVSPVYYLLLPFYILFPYPETLQIGQAALLLLGVLPLWLLAGRRGLSLRRRVLLCLCYCAYPALHCGCFYDLHENCFLPVLLLFLFWFYESRRWGGVYLFALLVLGVKEDAFVYLCIFALYVLLSCDSPFAGRRGRWHGLVLAALAVGYFALVSFLLTRYGQGVMSYRYENLIGGEGSLLGALRTAVINPGYLLTQIFRAHDGSGAKLLYLAQLLLPLGLLPFFCRRPARLLLCTPLLLNLLTLYQYQYNINFQYQFGVLAFLFYAATLNFADLPTPTARRLGALACIACVCLSSQLVLGQLGSQLSYRRAAQADLQQIEEELLLIPEDASVSATTFLVPHLADRAELYETTYHYEWDEYGNRVVKTDVDYVVIDLRFYAGDDSYRAVESAYLLEGYVRVHPDTRGILILAHPSLVAAAD